MADDFKTQLLSAVSSLSDSERQQVAETVVPTLRAQRLAADRASRKADLARVYNEAIARVDLLDPDAEVPATAELFTAVLTPAPAPQA